MLLHLKKLYKLNFLSLDFNKYDCFLLFLILFTRCFLMSTIGKSKSNKKAKTEPTKQDMHAVVVDILKEVDFNTVSNTSPGIHV